MARLFPSAAGSASWADASLGSEVEQADRRRADWRWRSTLRRSRPPPPSRGRLSAMSYWTVARLEPHRERLALHCLDLNGYAVYFPRLREHRISHGRKIEVRPPLFPGYCFFVVELQWHTARWSVGIIGLIMDGIRPARVADGVIEEIRSRERGGLLGTRCDLVQMEVVQLELIDQVFST